MSMTKKPPRTGLNRADPERVSSTFTRYDPARVVPEFLICIWGLKFEVGDQKSNIGTIEGKN